MCGYINRKGGPVWKSLNRALVGTSSSTGANRPPRPSPYTRSCQPQVYFVRGCEDVHCCHPSEFITPEELDALPF